MASVNKIKQEYISTLENLPNNELVIILLIELAGKNTEHAKDIFEIIKSYLAKVRIDMKLAVLCLIDCIIKRIGEPYTTLFTQDIISIVYSIFQQVDLLARIKIWKLRQTWFGIIPLNKLYALDNILANLDPTWGSMAPPPPPINSNLNSMTTTQLHNEEVASTVPLMLNLNHVLINPEIHEMQQKVLDKQKQLLELQQYKLMLQLKQSQTELPENGQNENILQSVAATTSMSDVNQADYIRNAELEKNSTVLVSSVAAVKKSLNLIEISDAYLLDHQHQQNVIPVPLDLDSKMYNSGSSPLDSNNNKCDLYRKNRSCDVMSASENATNVNYISNAKEGHRNDSKYVVNIRLPPLTSITAMKRPSSVYIESPLTKKKKSVISEGSIEEETISPMEPGKLLAPPSSMISKQVDRSKCSITITKDKAVRKVPTNNIKPITSKLIDEQNFQTVSNNRFTADFYKTEHLEIKGKCSRKNEFVNNKMSPTFPPTNHFGRYYNKCSSIMGYENPRKNKWSRWNNPPSPYVWRAAKPDFQKFCNEPKETPHCNQSARLPTVVKNRTKIIYNNPPQFLKTNYSGEDLFNGSSAYSAQSRKPLQEIFAGWEDTQNKSQPNDGPVTGYQETNRHFVLNEFIKKLLNKSSTDSSTQPEIIALFENQKPNFIDPKSLKIHQPSLIEALYGGMQCKNCGMRFKQSKNYGLHMNWHLQQHRNKKKNCRASNHSRYPFCAENYKELENLKQQQNQHEDSEKIEILTYESSKLQNAHCEVCHEEFKQDFGEKENEWHLRSAVYVNSKVYHVLCYNNYQTKFLDETSSKVANDNLISKLAIKEEPIENSFIEISSELVKLENDVFETAPLVCNETGDGMYPEVVHSIDGNIEFNSKPPISKGKIKINLTKPVIVPAKGQDGASKESKADFSDLSGPWLPIEELVPCTVKPPLKDLELKSQPLVEKGHELVSLCSVM